MLALENCAWPEIHRHMKTMKLCKHQEMSNNAMTKQCIQRTMSEKGKLFIIRTKQSSQQMLKTLKFNCLFIPDLVALEFWLFTKVYWLILNANNIHTFSSYLFALYQMILINCASLRFLQMIFSPHKTENDW